MNKLFLLLALLCALPAFAAEQAANPAQAAATQKKPLDPVKMAEVLQVRPDDIVLGQNDAPLTLVEYSSLSCSHCAHFANDVLPALKKDFIDTGKLRLVSRDFPLNAPAMRGAMLVQCAPAEKRAKFVEVLFKLQSKWAFTPDFEEALKKIAAVGGLSAETFDACMKDKAIEEHVLKVRQEAGENLDIQGTPSFFLNGKLLVAKQTPEAFAEALNAILTAK